MAVDDTREQVSGPGPFVDRVRNHLRFLYPDADIDALCTAVIEAIGISPDAPAPPVDIERWSHADAVLITYGDSIVDGTMSPLSVLADVLVRIGDTFSMVHILPFAPYSSDRGFSVVDYSAVDPELGTWEDIAAVGRAADLMMDLVCNHASTSSEWFSQFLSNRAPGRDYFFTAEPDADTSAVVRPRAQPLLQRFETSAGPRSVWCTFSADQADLDYTEPRLLLEILRVLDLYVSHGARFIRLDAVAFLWKQLGTPCIHLPQTHEMVRLWRTLLERRAPSVAIVTETNVPSDENLSYLGTGDEAHLVYNFPLPPLVIDALLTESTNTLSGYLTSQPDPPDGCTYFNFLASHDGIGVRPAEGLLSHERIDRLIATTHERGGLSGSYDTPTGPRPYELNVSLWDLLAGQDFGLERFLCAHNIMFGLRGVPAVYVNSLFAVPNDRPTAEVTGVNRDISRARIPYADALSLLAHNDTVRAFAVHSLLELLNTRRTQPSFHPDAPQEMVDAGSRTLAFWRGHRDDPNRILAVHNCSSGRQSHRPADLGLPMGAWVDLASPERELIGDIVDLAPFQCRWLVRPVAS